MTNVTFGAITDTGNVSFYIHIMDNKYYSTSLGGGGGILISEVTGSILAYPVPASKMVQQMPWYVLSCPWDGAYKRILDANG